MSRKRTAITIVAVVAVVTALGLATTESASAAIGTPGSTVYTQVSASGGLGGVLTLGSGFSVYRSPSASQYQQDISIKFNVWKWNGGSWGTAPIASVRSSARTNAGQYARFPALSIPVYSSGNYTVTVNETWAYTNGTVIATQQWNYNTQSDYLCIGPRDGTCAEMNGWVDLLMITL